MKTLAKFGIGLLSSAFTAGVLVAFIAFGGLWYFGRDLPDYEALANYQPPIVSRVYASNGTLIGEFASEKRIFVPYAEIPKRVADAFVSAEDQRFFTHPGIDLLGIGRALKSHFIGGHRLRGASTITQQVAKNFFLSPERSLARKVREMMLAFRIERAFSKEKILELYLNQIYLGRQSYGVAAAAQTYFRKSLDDLTVAETAYLAALPRAPSALDPRHNPRRAIARRNYVIQRMREDGYITQAEADEAKVQPLGVKAEPRDISKGAEYFVEEVRREMLAKYGEQKMQRGGYVIRSTIDTRLQAFAHKALHDGLVAYDRRHGYRGPLANLETKYGKDWARNWRRELGEEKAPSGHGAWPLAVVLSVDPRGANIAMADSRRGRIPLSELTWARRRGKVSIGAGKPPLLTAVGPAIRRAGDVLKPGDVILVERLKDKKADKLDAYTLREIPEVTGALVAMDPHTGRVLALSGGFSFWLSQFDNVTQAWRQPGSSFKPYVYLAALGEGYTPTTIILDAPVVVNGPGGTVYKPQNDSGKFYGPTTMREALIHSRNIATLRLAEATGLDRIADLAGRLGVSNRIEPTLSMALGAYETTPLRQVTAYSMIVNGGKRITPTLVDRIQDRYGHTIYRHTEATCDRCSGIAYHGQSAPEIAEHREQVLDRANAFQIVSMLEDVVRHGTGIKVATLGRPVAGKTGTTNDEMDAWFVGFTPDLAAAVWVGFDSPRSLGPLEQGGITAAPIFRNFMQDALAGTPIRDFNRPDTIVVVPTGNGYEYYKRGTEPGTGHARVLDGATADAGHNKSPVGNGMGTVY